MGNIYHEWNGTILTITSDSGTSSCDLKGAKGDTGIRGAQGAKGEIGIGAQGERGEKGEKGEAGSVVISTELTSIDEAGGYVYTQTFNDGSTATFTAPKGEKGDTGAIDGETVLLMQQQIDKNAADIELILNNPDTAAIDSIKELVDYMAENGEVTSSLQTQITDIKNNYTKKSELLDMVYPVGAVYVSLNSTEPSVLFGGSWQRIQDRFLLAAGSSYSVGSTGGEAAHTLTDNEMPRHSHQEMLSNGNWNYNAVYNQGGTVTTNEGAAITDMTVTAKGAYAYVGYAGGGAAHNNMPPYLTAYMWQRTA